MGTWGSGILDNDLSLDIKEEYLNFIGNGHHPCEATLKMMEIYKEELNDVDESNIFWLVLAFIQLEAHQLIDLVKETALEIIILELDLEKWKESPEMLTMRKKS